MTTALPAHLNVLLVEDGATCRVLAETVLRQAGHAVRRVGDGVAAFEAVAMGGYDLVLMDILLPLASGYQATVRIRDWEALHGGHVHIIAVTACATPDDRELAFAAGMDGYVSKPYRPAELLTAIDAAMVWHVLRNPA